MPLNEIKQALYNHLDSLSGLPDIHYSNVDSNPTGEYIRPDVLPATTESIGVATTDKEIGVFQVSIYVAKGSGELKAANLAQIILNGFPRNTQLPGVRIDKTGSIGPSIFIDGWSMTPISILYQSIC